jgi:hypothetical protein
MRTKVGLWIDHRKAIVVAVTDKGEETGLVISMVEKQLQRSGDSPLKGRYESQKVPADDSRQRKFTRGPGEAKGELKQRLKKSKLGGRIVGIETVDKMTNRQISAKIRQYFAE